METSEGFAPASCGNVAVGYDILGMAFKGVGDQVTLTRRRDEALVITAIESKDSLPKEIDKNICSAVIAHALEELHLSIGFDIAIRKGIALSSGMGGSAASAVAALRALSGFLIEPFTNEELASLALHGETMASGEPHGDNIAPAVYGGITLVRSIDPLKIIPLPIPKGLYAVVVHPQIPIETKGARALLKKEIPLFMHVKQSANIASFIAALYTSDFSLIGDALADLLIEPQRKHLIPGFDTIKKEVLALGALGMSISGSGPSVFALTESQELAEKISQRMISLFSKEGIEADGWVSMVGEE